jgi:hypothetical protein
MSFPITGAIILIVGLFFFFFSSKLLYAATILSIPFSATAVVNVRWGGSEKGVTAWLFFAALWVIKDTLSGVPPWRKPGWFASRRARYGLLAFLGAVILSLCVPMLLNGTSWVPDPRIESSGTIPLRFGPDNVTQTAYLVFGVLVAIFAAAANCSSAKIFYTLKLYVASSTFAAAWGLFEMWCNVTGHNYPAYIFNTSKTESALGFTEVLTMGGDSLARVSSVALEPSVLAEELLLGFVVLLVCLGLRHPLLGRKLDYGVLILIAATLLVSTSTTAYIGILVALLMAAISLSRVGKTSKLLLVMAGALVGAAALVSSAVPMVGQLMTMMLLNKLGAGSTGVDRFQSVALGVQDFLRYPIFGAGWHNVPCWDLVILILANTGIIGLIAFGSFLLPILRTLWVSTKRKKPVAAVLLSAVVLIVILAEAAGLTYSTGYVWLVFGLGAGAIVAARNEPVLQSERPADVPSRLASPSRAELNSL